VAAGVSGRPRRSTVTPAWWQPGTVARAISTSRCRVSATVSSAASARATAANWLASPDRSLARWAVSWGAATSRLRGAMPSTLIPSVAVNWVVR
jgi:hypothetical protein